MKKMIIALTALMPMVVGVATFATGINNIRAGQEYLSVTSHMTSQGTHCSGTVGCSCPGFSPITNGDVWQQAYCKHCNHAKRYHK